MPISELITLQMINYANANDFFMYSFSHVFRFMMNELRVSLVSMVAAPH